MKRLLFILTAFATLWGGVGCTNDNDTTEYYLVIDPETVNLGDATEQSFDLTITSNVHYRINPQDSWITVSESSSEGDTRIYSVSIEENTSTESRTGTVNIIGDNVTPQRLTINQAGKETEEPDPDPTVEYLGVGIFAQWNLGDDVTINESTFTTEEAIPVTGNGGAYAIASEGNAKIEFYYGDQTDVMVLTEGGSAYKGTSRAVGGNGDLYVKGGMAGDYWLLTVTPEKTIPAGSVIKFTFSFGIGNTTTDKWMLEYSCDGGEYLPIGETTKATDTWTQLFSTGEAASGSMEVTYNYLVRNKYQLSEKQFTVTEDTEELKIRMMAAGCLCPFSKVPTQKGDCINNSLESRFSPTVKYLEDGTANEAGGQPVILEIVSVPAE